MYEKRQPASSSRGQAPRANEGQTRAQQRGRSTQTKASNRQQKEAKHARRAEGQERRARETKSTQQGQASAATQQELEKTRVNYGQKAKTLGADNKAGFCLNPSFIIFCDFAFRSRIYILF